MKLAESGEIIRFSWRVLDPDRAATLSNQKLEPSLTDPQAGISLVVPTVENIGMLRQTSAPPPASPIGWPFQTRGGGSNAATALILRLGRFGRMALESNSCPQSKEPPGFCHRLHADALQKPNCSSA